VYIILSVSFRLDAESRVYCANRNPFPLYRFLLEFTLGFPLPNLVEDKFGGNDRRAGMNRKKYWRYR
jgi:hypothetical protein